MKLLITVIVTVLLFSYSCGQFVSQQSPTVSTTHGSVIGRSFFSTSGQSVYAFQGIPYAEPPVGDLRWKKPEPKAPWNTVWQATQYASACPQNGRLRQFSREDCLYLNIFTPTIQNQRLPVMFYLHGGDLFSSGSSSEYQERGIGNNLVARQVVVVTANYRLGALGMFSTQDDLVPGNVAFFDQLAALNWTRANIQSFGGDPDSITLFGSGSGAISTALHTLSPLSRGMFKQVILQSGSALIPDLLSAKHNNEQSRNVAVNTGCAHFTAWEEKIGMDTVIECLRRRGADEILRATTDVYWNPVVDGEFLPEEIDDDADLDDHDLITDRTPYNAIIGTTRDEWGYFFIPQLFNNRTFLQSFSRKQTLNEAWELTKFFPEESRVLVARLAQPLYADGFDGRQSEDRLFWFDRTVKMHTEAMFAGPAYREANSLIKAGATVYMYQFDYLTTATLVTSPWRGVIHGWEEQYIFGSPGTTKLQETSFNPAPTDIQMVSVMGELWTNFAKYSNPTPPGSSHSWQPLRFDVFAGFLSSNYLSLTPLPVMLEDFSPRSVDFWSSLVPEVTYNVTEEVEAKEVKEEECYSNVYFIGMWIAVAACIVLLLALLIITVVVYCTDRRKVGKVHISSPIAHHNHHAEAYANEHVLEY